MASTLHLEMTALTTLASLEHRLQRLTFYLNGDIDDSEQPRDKSEKRHELSAYARLTALEQSLAEFSHRKPTARGLLELRRSSDRLSSFRNGKGDSLTSTPVYYDW